MDGYWFLLPAILALQDGSWEIPCRVDIFVQAAILRFVCEALALLLALLLVRTWVMIKDNGGARIEEAELCFSLAGRPLRR